MKTSEITIEQELDRKIVAAKAHRVADKARHERQAYLSDVIMLLYVVLIVVIYLCVIPIVPKNIADYLSGFAHSLWTLLPIWLLIATVKRVINYQTSRTTEGA